MSDATPRRVLPALVLAQFAGTSLWFTVNAVMPDLQREFGWPAAAVGTLSSVLQLGFIAGTLLFALLAVADRFSARWVFLLSSLAGAGCTLGAWAMVGNFDALLGWRFATGFFLAGIYPVGMKIASQWFPRGLGAALGVLIGALVVGSASAHALRGLSGWGAGLPWSSVLPGVAALAAAGGVLLFVALPEPAAPRRPSGLQWRALATIVTDRRVRASVLGYFGHMWELYTMWVMAPLLLAQRLSGVAWSFAAFAVLAAGAIGCVGGGWFASRVGSARVAGAQLATSGLCCLAAPLLVDAPVVVFGAWLVIWGITVAGDSPQFSALTASNAPPHAVGSVLTLANSIGFAISAVSIELFVSLSGRHAIGTLLPWLAIGPALGLLALGPLLRERPGPAPAVTRRSSSPPRRP